MFAEKRSLDKGHPPSSKRARRCHDGNSAPQPQPVLRCDLSAQACLTRLQSTDTAQEALDALLTFPELLRAYVALGTGAYFYLAYALAHAIRNNNNQSSNKAVNVAAKCVQVMTVLLPWPGSPQAFEILGFCPYLVQAMRVFPQLEAPASALVHAISACQQVDNDDEMVHEATTSAAALQQQQEHYTRTVSW